MEKVGRAGDGSEEGLRVSEGEEGTWEVAPLSAGALLLVKVTVDLAAPTEDTSPANVCPIRLLVSPAPP